MKTIVFQTLFLLFGAFAVRDVHPLEVLDVQIRSEACADSNRQGPVCGWAFIKVDGVDRSLHKRGHNVVVLDAKTGRFLEAKAFDTHMDTMAGYRLKDYLKTLTGDLIVLIAIQDEGSRYSSPAIGEMMRIGPRRAIKNVYRGSLAIVGYAGEPRPSWVTQVESGHAKGPTVLNVKVPITAPGEVLDVQIRSEACADSNRQGPVCGWAFIKVNGVDRSLHKRGHNVVVFDAKTGRFLEAKAFDTHGDTMAGYRLRDYLKTLTGDLIVLIAIQDEGSRYSLLAIGEMMRIGPRRAIKNAYRGSLAIVGYAGEPRPSWVTQVERGHALGPSVLNVKVPVAE